MEQEVKLWRHQGQIFLFEFGRMWLLTVTDGIDWANGIGNEKEACAQGGSKCPRCPVPNSLAVNLHTGRGGEGNHLFMENSQ